MPAARSAPPTPLLAAVLGALSHGVLAALHRLLQAPGDPGAARAWLELVAQHPWRSTLALGLLWLALLLRASPPEPPPARPESSHGRLGGGAGVGRSRGGD